MTHTNNRNSGATDVSATANGPTWHYASIRYRDRLMGLLIETGDEDSRARRS